MKYILFVLTVFGATLCAQDNTADPGGADPLVRTGPPGPVFLLKDQADPRKPARGRPPYRLSHRLFNPTAVGGIAGF